MLAPAVITPVVVDNANRSSYTTGSYAFPAGANRFGLVIAAFAAGASGAAITPTLSGAVTGAWTLLGSATEVSAAGKRETVCAFYKEGVGGITETAFTVGTGGVTVNDTFIVVIHEDTAIHDIQIASAFAHVLTLSMQLPSPGVAVDGEVLIEAGIVSATTLALDGTFTDLAVGWDDGTRIRHGKVGYKILGAGTAGTQPTATLTAGTNAYGAGILIAIRPYTAPAPVNTVAPAITGAPVVGGNITCDNGTWSNSPTSYSKQWQRSSDGGTTWVNCTSTLQDGTPTGDTHTVNLRDVGCKLRCLVTATNAGGSTTAPSAAATSEIAVPSGISIRVVALPIAQSDNTVHTNNLIGAVLTSDTLIALASTSVPNIGGDAGAITDPGGNTWALDSDNGQASGSGYHVLQAFSAHPAARMNIGDVLTLLIKQTTVVGANALNSTTINVNNTTGFDASGQIVIGATTISYTGKTLTTLTGCSAHPAYTGGEIAHYHGQSPYWTVYAINSGDGRSFSFDQAVPQFTATLTPSAGPLTPSHANSVAFTLAVMEAPDTKGWLSPGAGWSKLWDGFWASHGSTDSDGISTSGESGYKMGVQARSLSAASSITGDYTHDGSASSKMNSLLVIYTLPDTTTSVSKSLAASYNVRSQVAKPLTASYNVRTQVAKSLSPSYSVRTQVAKSLAASYSLRAQVVKALVASYAVRASVAKSLTASYNLRVIVSKALSGSYSLREAVSKTLAASYQIVSQGSVGKTLTASYSVRQYVAKPVTFSYSVRTTASKSLSVSYQIRLVCSKSLSAAYNIFASVAKSFTSTYSLRNLVGIELDVSYWVGTTPIFLTGAEEHELLSAAYENASVLGTQDVSDPGSLLRG